MPVVIVDRKDVGEAISREIEYQRRRGFQPVVIEMSPETHEALRLHVRAPSGAILTEHDGVPVRLNRKMIGVNSWRVIYRSAVPLPERQIDALRRAGRIL